MKLNKTQQRILSTLKIAERPLTAREINNRIGIEPRNLRYEIQLMREQGVAVISGNYGYSIAKSKSEMLKTIKRLQAHVRSERNDIRALEKAMKGLEDDTIQN